MINNFNGPLTTAQEFALEVARNRVPGASPLIGFGRRVTGAVTDAVIWPGSLPFPIPPEIGTAITVVSTSANDTLAGTGVQKVEIHYLGVDLTPGHVIVNMNGITGVTTDEDGNPLPLMRFIQCMHVEQTGTYGQGAVGLITASTGATVYSLISAGRKRCESSARMVPKGKRAVIPFLVGSSISATSDSECEISVAATEFDEHQYTDQGLFIPFGSVGIQNGGIPARVGIPGVFREGTVIAMIGSASKAATLIAGYFGWVEDA